MQKRSPGVNRPIWLALPPPPRKVRRRESLGFLRWLPWLLLAPVAAGWGWALFDPAVRYLGTQTPARITDQWRGGVHAKPRFHTLIYEYKSTGNAMEGSEDVTAEQYDAYPPGVFVKVRVFGVLGFETSRLYLTPFNWRRFLLSPVAPLAGATLGLLLLIVVARWRERQARWLVRFGRQTPGHITVTHREGKPHREHYRITYLFESEKGKIETAQALIDAKKYYVGFKSDRMHVLFDVKNPRRSLIYEFADYAILED